MSSQYSCSSNIFHKDISNSRIRQKHKFLNEEIGLGSLLHKVFNRPGTTIQFELLLRCVDSDCACFESIFSKLPRHIIKLNDSIKYDFFIRGGDDTIACRHFSGFDLPVNNSLYDFICKSRFGVYYWSRITIFLWDVSVFVNVAPHRNCKSFHTWVETTHRLAENSRKHWNHSVDQINTRCSFLCFTIDNRLFGNKIRYIGNVNTHFIDFLICLGKAKLLLLIGS